MPEEKEDLTYDARMCDDCFEFGRWKLGMKPEDAKKAWDEWKKSRDADNSTIINIFGQYVCKSCGRKRKRDIKEDELLKKENPEFYAAMVREDAVRRALLAKKAAPRTAMPSSSSAYGASSTSLAPRASDSHQSSSQAVPALGSNILDAYIIGDSPGMSSSPEQYSQEMSAAPEQYPPRSSQAAPPPRPTLKRDMSAATSAAQAPAPNRSDQKRQRR